MKKELQIQYKFLVSFLGKTLGPSFEIVLHEIKGEEFKIISIANGEITNHLFGYPLSKKILSLLENKALQEEGALINHTILLKNGKKIRSSTMFIKDNQKIVGLLCINFDDTPFRELNQQLLQIIHPDMFVKNYLSDVSYNSLLNKIKDEKKGKKENSDVDSLMEEMLQEVKHDFHLPLNRLTKDEREIIISILYNKGFFNLKDSVNFAAKALFCSQATIYRALNKKEPK